MSDQLAVFIDFENVALWAEREFYDFEITSLIAYLQTRGPAVVKRAYADWSRFSRYRDALMNNSIDLIQIYSVRTGKNRADIRMAIDAFEIAMTRPQIRNYVIVSGDSDFGPLVAKLREYGRYTIGIGPRSITHDLLVRSCDEFVYLETALGELAATDEQSCIEIEQARSLLSRALQAHGQRGEIPILATRLKQTMLLMDPAFNEANFGYAQFKSWLEDHQDLVVLFVKDYQLFVAPAEENGIPRINSIPQVVERVTQPPAAFVHSSPRTEGPPLPRLTLDAQYKQVFNRLKMGSVDLANRRDVLRDIYREIHDNPGVYTLDDLIEELSGRYEAQGIMRSSGMVRDIVQLAIRQQAFEYNGQPAAANIPVWIAPGINTEASFIDRGEAEFIYAVIRAGLDIDAGELAYLLLNDRTQGDSIYRLIEDLKRRALVVQRGDRFTLPGRGMVPFQNEPALQVLFRDIEQVTIPDSIQPGAETARSMAKKAMLQRSQDFAASSSSYLLVCRLQWDAVEKDEPGATMEDLKWYMASYASAIAGKLSQVNRDYASARPYYLAFFSLVQEEDTLWGRMRGLINPMLAYFWSNAGRELDINVSNWNLSMSSPAQIAVYAATHPNPELRRLWTRITTELAQVNPGLLQRVANQLMLSRTEQPENGRVAEQIEQILEGIEPV